MGPCSYSSVIATAARADKISTLPTCISLTSVIRSSLRSEWSRRRKERQESDPVKESNGSLPLYLLRHTRVNRNPTVRGGVYPSAQTKQIPPPFLIIRHKTSVPTRALDQVVLRTRRNRAESLQPLSPLDYRVWCEIPQTGQVCCRRCLLYSGKL